MSPHLRRMALPGLVIVLLAETAAAEPRLPPGAVAQLGSTRLRHADRPLCVAFSPDGRTLVSGGADGAVRAWDVATGEPTAVLRRPGSTAVEMRFTHGGSRLAVSFADGHVRFLDPVTLRERAAVATPATTNFTITPDGTLLACASPIGGTTVTEMTTELAMLELTETGPVQFHPGGKMLAATAPGGVVTVYRVIGGKPVQRVNHGGLVTEIAFSPNGGLLATAGPSPDGGVKVWQVGRQRPVFELAGAGAPVAFLADGRLAAARASGVAVWDMQTREILHEVRGAAGAFAISPDGTKLAATGTGLRVRIWDVPTGKQLHADNDTYPDVALMVPAPNGRSLFVLAGDRAFRWPLAGSGTTPAGTLPGIATTAAVGGGRAIVATDHGLAIWDRFDPTAVLPANPTRTVERIGAGTRALAISPDGAWAACSGADRVLHLIDLATGKVVRSQPGQHAVLALAFTPDGRNLAVLGRDGFLRLRQLGRDGADDEEVWKLRIQRGLRGTVAVSPDGKLIAASSSGRLTVVDAMTGEEAFTVDRALEDGSFQAAGFTPDSRLLITGAAGRAGAIQLWDVASRTLVRRLTTGLGGVTGVAVFPDGSRVASTGSDEAVTVWDLASRPSHAAPSPPRRPDVPRR